MKFRTVGEVPTPRYSLDEYDDGDLDVPIDHQFEIISSDLLTSIDTLLILAPRIAPLLELQLGKRLAGFAVHTRRKLEYEPYTDLDGLQHDETEVEEHLTTLEIGIYQAQISGLETSKQTTGILPLPRIPESETSFVAKSVLKMLPPGTKVWVAAPGTSFGAPVTALYASKYPDEVKIKDLIIPNAAPPTLVQGAPAAFLSTAERLGLAALGLIVHSDGALGYEAMDRADIDTLKKTLFQLGGLRKMTADGLDLSTLYV